MSDHQFAVMWDCYGLENCVDITEEQQNATWAALKGDPTRYQLPNLMHWKLRARYNPQRNYEIYIFNASEGITCADIINMFKESPQEAANTIRRIGHKYYSDRRALNDDIRVIS